MRALELLRQYRKIFIFVTHDPYIPLLSDFRVVMASGAMMSVIHSGPTERELARRVRVADDLLSHFRERIRSGGTFSATELEALA